jgi:hypothetical protein
VTNTCDAAPMNELVNTERGVLVSAHAGARHNLATLAQFDAAALEAAIAGVLSMTPARWEALGAAARSWFLDNKRGFQGRVQRALNELATQLHARPAAAAPAAAAPARGPQA